MRSFNLFILLFLIWQQSTGQNTNTKIPRLNFNQFESYLHKQNDTLYVINFWASWCIPCRQEMPAFEKVREKYSNKKLKIILVSLDIPGELENRLLPYIRTNHIKSQVVLLDDANQNAWIDKVDPKWSGTIPFTLIYGRGFRESYERSFRFNQLDSIINLKL
jgi:thiol-disulfide isomerase/thioredoxin